MSHELNEFNELNSLNSFNSWLILPSPLGYGLGNSPDRPWLRTQESGSAERRKNLSPLSRLVCRGYLESTACRPWLSSYAAPRLNHVAQYAKKSCREKQEITTLLHKKHTPLF